MVPLASVNQKVAPYSCRDVVCCRRRTPVQTASTFAPAENILQELKWPETLRSKNIKTGATYQCQAPNRTIGATVTFSKQIQEQILHGSIGR